MAYNSTPSDFPTLNEKIEGVLARFKMEHWRYSGNGSITVNVSEVCDNLAEAQEVASALIQIYSGLNVNAEKRNSGWPDDDDYLALVFNVPFPGSLFGEQQKYVVLTAKEASLLLAQLNGSICCGELAEVVRKLEALKSQ